MPIAGATGACGAAFCDWCAASAAADGVDVDVRLHAAAKSAAATAAATAAGTLRVIAQFYTPDLTTGRSFSTLARMPLVRTRTSGVPMAVASGVLLALSFPRYGHPALAWIALAPLMV